MSSELEFLNTINRGLNGKIKYVPNESVQSMENSLEHGGDCNDYVMAKAKALRMNGYTDDQMKVVTGWADDFGQAHSVLMVTPKDGGNPVIMDNRPDYQNLVPLDQLGKFRKFEEFPVGIFRPE